MTHEILSFQIGQCGNSIGLQFWRRLAQQHGLDLEGYLAADDLLQGIDNKHTFFHQWVSGKFVPRCIMLDLEPRVIHGIKNSEYSKLFDHQNMFVGEDGGGAGNNWASGFSRATVHEDTLLDLVRRETEAMDLMEGSLISHAISGGTGAGMGSFVLEQLADYFPKKTVQTYSVFPTSVSLQNRDEEGLIEGQYGDIVIEPYNSLLTLMRLTNYADSVIVLDNLALHDITATSQFLPLPSFANINKIASNVMTTSLAPIRYPSQMFSSLSDIVLSLTPAPRLHFLMTGYTPVRSLDLQTPIKQIMKTSVESIMRHLGRVRNMMVSIPHSRSSSTPHGYMSVFNILQGDCLTESVSMVKQAVSQFRRQERYLPWVEPVYQTTFCPWSSYQTHPNRVAGLTLTNHSSIVSFFTSILKQFKKLSSRKAYLDQMESLSGYGELRAELTECQESCESLISEYGSALTAGYRETPFNQS